MSQEIEWLLKEKYHGEKGEAFFADCKRLALGEPLGYIIGYIPFLNCTIWLDSNPLIPRVETEFWVEHAILCMTGGELSEGATMRGRVWLGRARSDRIEFAAGHRNKPFRVLDLCAGSGCIGVAVAHAIPKAQVDFSEIDLSHFPTIEKNLQANSIDRNRSTIYHTHLFRDVDGTYDFILSNPPYIDPALNRVDQSVLEHEPYVALFGGDGGLEIISDIIKMAPAHLEPHGQLWIEHEPEQVEAIQRLASESGFSVTTHADQYSVERYSILVLQ
jgi:HemK-like putative methylase